MRTREIEKSFWQASKISLKKFAKTASSTELLKSAQEQGESLTPYTIEQVQEVLSPDSSIRVGSAQAEA